MGGAKALLGRKGPLKLCELYFANTERVYRLRLDERALVPQGPAEIVVDGCSPNGSWHNYKIPVIDGAGNLYVGVGSPSNARSNGKEQAAANSKWRPIRCVVQPAICRMGAACPTYSPSLRHSPVVNSEVEALVQLTLEGWVSGEYANRMPSFAHLDDEALAAVLTYTRTHFGNQSRPVNEAIVRAVRRDIDK